MKHIKHFENYSDFESVKDSLVKPNISFIENGSIVEYLYDGQQGGGGSDEPEVDQYEYVDLGLSVKWATCNVGATKPEEYGLYFAWGETEGYTAEQVGNDTDKKYFYWYDYKYGTSSSNFTKYKDTFKLTLDLIDDAAHVNMGGNWRMPTSDEYQELLDNTTTARTTVNGVDGMKFTSTKEGYTDKYIFIPAASECYEGSFHLQYFTGELWSSSLYRTNVTCARGLGFNFSGARMGVSERYHGYSVRGVLE